MKQIILIIKAIQNLGGVASYAQIYEEYGKLTGALMTPGREAMIRKTIKVNSADSDHFSGQNIFYSPQKGSDIWGLTKTATKYVSLPQVNAVKKETILDLPKRAKTPTEKLYKKIYRRFDAVKYIGDIPIDDEEYSIRKLLQQRGILFVVRDSQGTDYDILPEEIADVIRTYYNVDIKKFSYEKLLESKYVKKKAYLIDILQKASVELGKNETIESLSYKVMRHIKAHNLIGGFTARDGLNGTDLVKWCNDIGVSCRGSKNELIDRIVAYYDDIQKIEVTEDDERALYYEFYEDLASRNLDKLRKQGIIDKDLECEHKFEEATNYLFEKILKNKPLMLKGTEHADGMLSFGNKLILWDNKSKETPVKLSDHIKQFDRYIKGEEKSIPVFIVIGPDFTDDSPKECLKYSMSNDTNILLITASELKMVAEKWKENHCDDDEVFPLGYFKQSGRFDISLISFS